MGVTWSGGNIVGAVAVSSFVCACAVTTSTCPLGTKLVGAQRPEGRAQWCEITDTATTGVSPTGRTFEGTLGFVQPTAMPGGIEGPFTSWHPNGALAMHGSYLNFGARSVPDGLWTFWYPSGQRRVLGQYHRGQPQGCFAAWDESGTRKTGAMEGDRLRIERCNPPSDDEVVALEHGGQKPSRSPASADFHLQSMVGPNRIGATNAGQVVEEPNATLSFHAAARLHIGRLRVGPTAGAWLGNNNGYSAVGLGATAGWRLPTFHPRIDSEVSLEVTAQRISVEASRKMMPGIANLTFWTPSPAIQANAAFALSPNLDAVFGLRMDGLPAREVDRDVVYCDRGCFAPVTETWSVGRIAYGVVFGIRLLVR